MHDITHRNIHDFVDAPPEMESSKGHESNSCDVTMRSASNEVVVEKKILISREEESE